VRTLTQRELNRALLARQGLLERTDRPIGDMLDAMGTLQAQYAPSMYVGLWSRLAGFERDALTRALQEREVVQATLMRVTIHLCSRADYWPLTIPIREARKALWLRAASRPREPEMEVAAATLRDVLKDGRVRKKAIDELFGKAVADGIGLWVDLVRVPPSGTWERRRADLYAVADTWIPQPEITPDQALDHLVTRYLTGFGPAAKDEIANWAGLSPKRIEPSLQRLTLARFLAEDGTELLDLPDLPLPDPNTPAPVRFLGTWDAALLVHARRALVLPEQHRPKIFNTKMPQSVGTFLIDGAVAGAWRPDGTIEPFEDLTATQRRQVEEEASRLADFSA
jgi:hypothetical protein